MSHFLHAGPSFTQRIVHRETIATSGISPQRTRDVSQSFERRGQPPIEALRNLSFSVKAREFVSVLGQSGCRKSTLLQLLAGLIQPISGQIMVNAEPVNGPSPDYS